MSVIALGTDGSVTRSLEIALSQFGSVLTDDERKELQQIKGEGVPDASAALLFTAKLDESNSTRRGKSIGTRAYSILQSIQRFSAIVDTFISAHPDIAALVWGSVKLTLLIAANTTSYFESLADLFMGLNKLFPQFDEYQLLFPSSPKLRESICGFHASVVQLCKQAIRLARQPWPKKMISSLRGELGPQIENIERCSKDVEKSIALAKAMYDRREQELQEQERKLAAKTRTKFAIFMTETQKELESARQWQIQRDQNLLREKKMGLLNSLSTYAHQMNFHQTRKKRHINTATWLFSTPEFTKWRDGKVPSVFILTGKLGSGKTVLASSVVDYLYQERTRTDEFIAFVFPRFDDSISLSAATVLRSIIRQVLEPNDMTKEIEKQLGKFEASYTDVDMVQTLLQHSISRFSTLYIVIDALDEFEKEERSILLQNLASTISVPDSKVKLFLVGRSSVAADIRKMFPISQVKSADCRELQADIQRYTQETVVTALDREEEPLALQDPALAQEIIQALIHGADGMFLWVDYQIAEICECTCDNEIREVLTTLPKNLAETFDRALKRIAKRGYAKTAREIFQWAATTKRPLTLDELGEALSYEPGKPFSVPGKRPNGLERIATWCGNLVQLDEELHTVQFPHHSILQHFLEQPSDPILQDFHIKLEEADHLIGEICVTYLNSNNFKTELIRNIPAIPTQLPKYVVEKTLNHEDVTSRIIRTMQKLNTQSYNKSTTVNKSMIMIKSCSEDPAAMLQIGHPFIKYSSEYWLPHTRNFEGGKSKTWNLWKQMIRGSHSLARTPWLPADFHDGSAVIYRWLDENDHSAVFREIVSIAKPSSAEWIHLICRYAAHGRQNYINFLLKQASKEELVCGLLCAATGGYFDAVEKLLDAGADVNAARSDGRTALQAAAKGGHLIVVEKLLNAGADVNAARYDGRTALQAAAISGHLIVVEKLLNAGADINAARSDGQTALQAAAEGGHLIVAEKLLDAGADVNTTRYDRRTALQAAAEGGDFEAVQRLINAGADVNAVRYDGRTALQLAAEGGDFEVAQRLINAKADVNATGYEGRTALQAAADDGNLKMVRRLLKAKADVNATGYEARTALELAAARGHSKIVALLKSFGAS